MQSREALGDIAVGGPGDAETLLCKRSRNKGLDRSQSMAVECIVKVGSDDGLKYVVCAPVSSPVQPRQPASPEQCACFSSPSEKLQPHIRGLRQATLLRNAPD